MANSYDGCWIARFRLCYDGFTQTGFEPVYCEHPVYVNTAVKTSLRSQDSTEHYRTGKKKHI